MRSARLLLAELLAFAVALGIFAVAAVACEGGGGGPELTGLSTKLSGGGKEGESITVTEGTKVKDKATLTGKNASKATGKVTYKVYSESACKTLVASAGEVTVSGESVPASSEEELEGGKTYYWQAHYGGDSNNAESSSPCTEILTVQAKTSLTTKLSGESKEAEELTVLEGSKVKDKATLSGTNSSTATGKALYKVFSDKECKTLVKEAGEVTVTSGSIPASSEVELTGGASYYWQVTYKGDALHQESTSTCGKEISTVKAKTSLSTMLSGEGKEGEELTVLEGSKAKDKAMLSGTNSSTAEGKVLYKIYSDSKCEHEVEQAGEESVSGGTATASEEKELTGGKTYYWQATYKGDSLHQESQSECGKEVLVVKAETKLATTLSGEGKEGTEIEVLEGAKVTDKATLTGTNSSSAGGKVTYKVYSDSKCEKHVAEAGEVTVTSGTVPASSEEELTLGTYYWQATYAGDSLHQSSKSSCGSEITVVKTATSLTTSLSGEGKEGEELEVVEGKAVSDDATLSGLNASLATGTVTYKVYSDSKCEELVAEAGKKTVTAGIVPSSNEETLSPGAYYWQATYSGDSHNGASTSMCGGEIELVQGGEWLTTSLVGGSSGEREVLEPVEAVEGTAVKDTTTLHGKNASTATGTVKYDVYTDAECTKLATAAGEVTVTGGSIPSSSEETLSAGTYYWQASYSGDTEHSAEKSPCFSEMMVVKPATSLATSLSGDEQSGETITVSEDTEVTDQATLSGTDATEAGGTVEYNVYSDSECKTLAAEAGAVEVSSGSVPASNLMTLPAGTYYWQAVYSGDAKNAGSKSTCGTEVSIVKPATSLATSLSGGEQSGGTISVAEEVGVTDHATLSGQNASSATGKVKYKVYSDSKCKTLVAEAGEVTVTGGSVPNSSEEKLSPGTYYWQATYSGDSENADSRSPCGAEIAVVKATALTTSLSGGEQSGEDIEVLEGAPATDHATLSSAHASKATGTVKYKIFEDDECKTLVKEAGEVTVSGGVVPASTAETLSAGTYYWQASYSGDSENASSTSLCGSEKLVVKPVPGAALEEVAFFGSQKVVLDHPIDGNNNNLNENLAIRDYPQPGQNEVQWKSARVGAKNWPIVYVKGETMEAEGKFSTDAITRALATNNELESATVTGTTTVFGKTIKFESKTFNNAQLRGNTLATGRLKAEQALPNENGYQKIMITWEWTTRISGVNQPAASIGTSSHNLYVLFGTPTNTPIAFTLLDIAAKGTVGTARAVATTEAETIKSVWSGFTEKAVGPETPLQTVRRTYEPARGTIGEGPVMRYWAEGTNPAISMVGLTLTQTLPLNPLDPPTTLAGLLRTDTGNCFAWAAAFTAVLEIEGVPAKTVALQPTVAAGIAMLVKNWSFAVAGANTPNQVTRERGIPGQGRENPYAVFGAHAITMVERPNNDRELYDPSYGSGPVSFVSPVTTGGQIPQVPIEEYQAGIAGFCDFVGANLQCRKTGAAPSLRGTVR